MTTDSTSVAVKPKRRVMFRLRGKLLLVSLALFAIPWAGYEYVQEMESFLRLSKQVSLSDNAQAVAAVMHNRRTLFEPTANIAYSINDNRNLYARKLQQPIQLDGYIDDWSKHLEYSKRYSSEALIQGNTPYQQDSLSYQHILGRYGRYLYALFIVKDESIIYRAPNSLSIKQSDHLQIALEDRDGLLQRYMLTTTGPGWVNAHLLSDNINDDTPVRPEVRIKGEWQETTDGYILELRIPRSMLKDKLAFAIADVDDQQTRQIKYLVTTSGGTQRVEDLGSILTPSPDIEKIIASLDRGNSRIWVINRNRHVLALAGSLTHQNQPTTTSNKDSNFIADAMHAIYRLILTQPTNQLSDNLQGASRLEGEEVISALKGTAALRWRGGDDEQAIIVAAAHPVWDNGEVIGAVVVEQTTNDILTLQNTALENLLNVTLVVFLAATIFLLTFATRLSNRIRRLHRDAELAINVDGRIQGQFNVANDADELGDLSRSFSGMMERVSDYTAYLETMASKLSHELRTPLAVVKSSLDNLDMQSLPEGADTYTKRAREGVERLSNILSSMNEATRLEQALESSDFEHFRIDKLVSGCIEGYRSAFPEQPFSLTIEHCEISIFAAPDRLAQMLDKLISNAIDFCTTNTSIDIQLSCTDKQVLISVSNQGPPLPDAMHGRLFDSMVSLRESKQDSTHLGLGLYIVRLIAEFHQGEVHAENLSDLEGAMFTVSLPRKTS